MKEFYIIRHGETDFNKQGIVQGRGINSDLNEEGRKQAQSFYKAYRHIPFDGLYTSTLKRTHQTIEPFIKQGYKWEQLLGLDELDWGLFEGQPSTAQTKAAFHKIITAWAGGDLEVKFEGGESPLEVNARQKEALTSILSKTEEQKVLICMHGRAIRLFLCLLLDKDISEMDTFPHVNLSLYRLGYANGKFELLDFNNTDHLNG